MKLIFELYIKVILFLSILMSTAIAEDLTPEDLTIVSFGGAYSAAQKKHMIDPFTEKTGHKILFKDYSGGIAEIKAQVKSGKIEWDVVDVEVIDLERACSEGLLEEIAWSKLPNGDDGTAVTEDFTPAALTNPCGIGLMVWSIIFAYDESKMGDKKPNTIADLFDVKNFPGKRAFRKRAQVNLEWALIADGADPHLVYEILSTQEGQARAFKKLDSIKDDIIWFDSWSQAPQMLNDGEAVFVQSANGRIFSAIINDKKPFSIVWKNHVYDLDAWAIIKGSKKKEAALEFVKFATSSKPLAGMADVAYGPTRSSSAQYIDPDVNENLPTSHIRDGIKADSSFWADYGESLSKKFNEWLLK